MMDDLLPLSDQIEGAPHPRETTTLFGQAHAETAFLEAYNSKRFHHAWMITGPKGIGKATLAWRIAKFLLSQPVDDGPSLFGDPDPSKSLDTEPEHPVIRRVMAGSEGGLCVIRRAYDEKRKRFKSVIAVEDVRKLKNFFALSAADGGRRVVIVDAADDMNVNAANALLKVLEEPPARTTLLLVCHQPSRLLPTIRSRCRTLRLTELSHDDVNNAIERAGFDADGEDSAALAALSAGSVGEAIRLSQMGGPQMYRSILALLAQGATINRQDAIKFAESFAGKGASDEFEIFIIMLDLLLTRLAKTGATGLLPGLPVSGEEGRVFQSLCPNPRHALRWAEGHQEILSRLRHGRAVNLDPVALILDTVFKLEQCAKGA
jgi:DNA polymerase-3 subunit delta'